jgi:hypothetical protein
MKIKTLLLAAALGLATATGGRAAILASWDINGVDVADGTGIDQNVSPYAFSTTGVTGIQDARLQLSSSVNPTTSADQYGVKVSTNETSLADAITAGHYFEISITVAAGYTMNLTSIEMVGQTSSTGWDNAAFMSSVAGYTSGNELDSVTGISGSTGGLDTDGSGWGAPIVLSGAQYQGLIGTTTFRIYGWGATSGAGISYIRDLGGDDFVINGTVIPEPSSIIMIGLVGLAAVVILRKRN